MLTALTVLQFLLVLGAVLLIGMSLLAPFETLGWWAGWMGGSEHRDLRKANEQAAAKAGESAKQDDAQQAEARGKYFAVYFSGVGDVAGDFAFPEEMTLLQRLRERLPDLVIVDDIFPYSVVSPTLTARRSFMWLWKRLVEHRTASGDNLLTSLINVRNFMQVLVSSDERYGPIYGYRTAQLVRDSLLRAGYREGSQTPLTLIGFSGGAQMCVSCVPYLRVLLRAPVQVAAIGGVLCDDPAVRDVEHLYYLYGKRDWIQWAMTLIFPGRWPWLRYSPWNRAKAAGKITRLCIGPMGHNDPGGYFDAEALLPNGKSHAEQTIDHLLRILRRSATLRLPLGRLAGLEGLESLQSQNWDFSSQPAPAGSYEEAVRLVDRVQQLDGKGVHASCRTVLLTQGKRAAWAVVLLHGFTNCPCQWHAFAAELHRQGANVLVPRLPRHGLANRMTESLAELRAEELLAMTDTAVDIARGLGERVTLMGLSLGAVLATWTVLHRDDVDDAMLIAPSFGFRLLPAFLESQFTWLTGVLPSVFLWWDPRVGRAMKPLHAYPRFPTGSLFQMGRITRDVKHESKKGKPHARRVMVVMNEADLAVRSETLEELLRRWRDNGYGAIDRHTFRRELKLPHDVIDPAQNGAQIDVVYPVLRALLLAGKES